MVGGLIQTSSGRGLGFGVPRTKRSGSAAQSGFQGALALREHLRRSSMMDIVRSQHGDAAMTVLVVLPREERSAVGRGVLDVEETTGEAGVVLQGLEPRLRERVVIGD